MLLTIIDFAIDHRMLRGHRVAGRYDESVGPVMLDDEEEFEGYDDDFDDDEEDEGLDDDEDLDLCTHVQTYARDASGFAISGWNTYRIWTRPVHPIR